MCSRRGVARVAGAVRTPRAHVECETPAAFSTARLDPSATRRSSRVKHPRLAYIKHRRRGALFPHLRREASPDVQRELRDAPALEPLVAEVPVQAHAHGDALLPHVDEEHRPEHLGLELRAVHPREREEYRELEEADGVEGRPRHLDEVQARIFHEPGRGERLRLRRLDRSGGDAHGGCVSAPDRAATVAESRVGQVSFQGVNRHWAGFCSDCGAEKRRWMPDALSGKNRKSRARSPVFRERLSRRLCAFDSRRLTSRTRCFRLFVFL